MVDIVDRSVRVNQLNEILDNLDDIILSQHTHIRVGIQSELAVDTVAAYLAQVITLVREEQVLEHLACAGVIGRIGVTQLAIDVQHSLFLRVAGVFLQGIEDDSIFVCSVSIFVQQD